jgi:hypothetical protein
MKVGDQITIDWMEGMPGNGKALPNTFTFDLDANGNLLLTGDNMYFDAELAGLYGENYNLTHYTDLSDLCSPFKCRYATEFRTPAIHDPYLHTKVDWSNMVTDMPGAIHIIEMGGITIFTGGLTVADVMVIGMICATTGPACTASVITLGPAVPAGIIGTIGLARGTFGAFMAQFTEATP